MYTTAQVNGRVRAISYWLSAVSLSVICVAFSRPNAALARVDCTGLSESECTRVSAVSAVREQDDKQTDAGSIVGGSEATESDAKWTAALGFKTGGGKLRQYCGGTLVNKRWIVTAAHCEVVAGDVAVIGRKVLTDTNKGMVIPIAKVVNHPEYNADTNENDIAVLELASDAPQAGIPVESQDVAKSGKRLTVLGWGRLSEGGPSSNTLMRVGTRVVSNKKCTYDYEDTGVTIAPGMICAREAGKDSCQGDSGGPLVTGYPTKPKLVGVVSFGIGCAQEEFPGVYTRVFDYRDWLHEQTGLDL